MTEHKILVEEILQREITVSADSLEEAILKVENEYKDSKIILDEGDLIGHDVHPLRLTIKDL